MHQGTSDARSTVGLSEADAIEALLARLDAVSRRQLPGAEFYALVLGELSAAIPLVSAAVWVESDSGIECAARRESAPGDLEQLTPDLERRLVAATFDREEPQLIPPLGQAGAAGVVNSSTCLQCCVARRSAGVPGLLVRAALPSNAEIEVRETTAGLLAAVADIALTYQLHQRVRHLQDRDGFWRELDRAIAAMHSSDRLNPCAQLIAEHVRHLLQADRVAVLVRRGKRCRLQAVSASARLDRRSRQARLLERLAASVVGRHESLEFTMGHGRSRHFASAEHLDEYLDETHVRAVRCVPLRDPSGEGETKPPVGALAVEQFSAEGVEHWDGRIDTLAGHAAQALARAVAESRRGWKRLLWPFGSLTQGVVVLLLLAGLVAAGLALAWIPADFTIEAEGRLMPVRRRGVFAPADAIISEILVDDGAVLRQGDPLLRLIDPELDLQSSRLQGELETATANLAAVQARKKLRLRDREIDTSELSIQEEELKATISGLERQLQVVDEQRTRLTVSSPLAGEVARWDLREVLQGLPVRHGQHLMDVYDVGADAPWQLELQVPDDVSGYVRDAVRAGPPEVEFAFQTNAAVEYQGTLATFSDVTDIDAQGELSVRGTVPLEAGQIASPRRGASVMARIHCGRRSLGFVWFREVIEFVHRNVLF